MKSGLRGLMKRSTYFAFMLFCLAIIFISIGSIMIHEGAHTGVTYTISRNGNEYVSTELNFSQRVIFQADQVNTNSCGIVPSSSISNVNESNVLNYRIPANSVSNSTLKEYSVPAGSYYFVSCNAKPGYFMWNDAASLEFAYLNMAGGVMIAAAIALLTAGRHYRKNHGDS